MEFFRPKECWRVTPLIVNEGYQFGFCNLLLFAYFDGEGLKGKAFPAPHRFDLKPLHP